MPPASLAPTQEDPRAQGALHIPEEAEGCFLIQSVPWGSERPRPALFVGRPGQETGIRGLGVRLSWEEE